MKWIHYLPEHEERSFNFQCSPLPRFRPSTIPCALGFPSWKILAAHARGSSVGNELALNPSEEAEFMFIGKAMAHKSDRASELVPIARSLAHLPDNIPLEVMREGVLTGVPVDSA